MPKLTHHQLQNVDVQVISMVHRVGNLTYHVTYDIAYVVAYTVAHSLFNQ